MSTLFVNTIYPDSGSMVNISGSLKISQSLIVADNIIMSGSIKLGDATTDSVSLTAEISSSIIPDATITYNLGSAVKEWNKIHAANLTASSDISSSGIVYGAVGKFDELELPPFTTITASGGISASIFRGDGSGLTGVGTTGSVLDVISVSVDTFVSGAGTGSFNHFYVSGEISGSVSASGTGSFQGGVVATGATGSFGYVKSTGDVSASGTGSFQGGINATGATGSFGFVSASGDISASGTGSFEHLIVTGEINSNVSASGTGSFEGGINAINSTGSFGYISSSGDISASGNIFTENITIAGEVLTDISASGKISASGFAADTASTSSFGYISSSGEIISVTSSMDHLILSGSSSMGYMFISASDELEYTISSSGTISSSYFAGDGRYLFNLTASVGVAAAHGSDTYVQFNDGGSNIGSDAGITYVKTTDILTVAGGVVTGEISASYISASGGFQADTLSTSSFGFISCSGDITSSGTGSFVGGINCISPGADNVDATGSFGYISCSGDISISGDIFATNVTASGGISGSLVKGQSFQAQVGNNLGYRFNLNNDSQINGVQYNTIGERAHLQIPSLPVSVTLPFSASATALVGGALTVGGATTIAGATTINGALDAASGFKIGGTTVSSTAAELNNLDGYTGTADDLNSIVKTTDEDIEASKIARYDSGGALKFKKVIKASTVSLAIGDSNALLIPSGAEAQTYTLPAVAEAKGVTFRFIAGSEAAHRISQEENKLVGYIIDNANDDTDSTMARTELSADGVGTITLVNPKIGDRLTIVSDGERYIVEGRTNDTPTLG